MELDVIEDFLTYLVVEGDVVVEYWHPYSQRWDLVMVQRGFGLCFADCDFDCYVCSTVVEVTRCLGDDGRIFEPDRL